MPLLSGGDSLWPLCPLAYNYISPRSVSTFTSSSLCLSSFLSLKRQSLDLVPTLNPRYVISRSLINYICKDPICKSGHILRVSVDTNLREQCSAHYTFQTFNPLILWSAHEVNTYSCSLFSFFFFFLLLFPFYRQRNQGTEGIISLTHVTQLERPGFGPRLSSTTSRALSHRSTPTRSGVAVPPPPLPHLRGGHTSVDVDAHQTS